MFDILRYIRKITFDYKHLSFIDKDTNIEIYTNIDKIEDDGEEITKRIELVITENRVMTVHIFSRPSRITIFLKDDKNNRDMIIQYFEDNELSNQEDMEFVLINGRKLSDVNLLRYSNNKDYIKEFFKNKE